jgi:hypothetical protein
MAEQIAATEPACLASTFVSSMTGSNSLSKKNCQKMNLLSKSRVKKLTLCMFLCTNLRRRSMSEKKEHLSPDGKALTLADSTQECPHVVHDLA